MEMLPPRVTLGEGNGNPLQYSCLENPTDGEAWWATVHGIAKSRTRLSDFTHSLTHSESPYVTGARAEACGAAGSTEQIKEGGERRNSRVPTLMEKD